VREQQEGSRAVARVVARCRPAVVPAYPITPQTHIVEGLGLMVRAGELSPCRFLTVESEFAAMSAAIGASAVGTRTYTATASQGLLYMAEPLFNASGLGLPIVLTVANRAIGAPINIWNDHSDAMSMRDCGWVQLYAIDNQHAVDLHVQAFALAERISVPVMVCVDGFVLTHASEPIDVPDQDVVDAVLPDIRPRQRLDPAEPVTIGAMVGPEAFTEVRYLAQLDLLRALSEFPAVVAQLGAHTGREVGPVTRFGPESARTVVIALGSVCGTIRAVLEDGVDTDGVDGDGLGDVALLALTMYRPFPSAAIRAAVGDAERVIVLERAFAPGAGGIVTADVRGALTGRDLPLHTVVAGLGGRPITEAALRELFARARRDDLPDVQFLDLDERSVHAARTSGASS